jgi:hypothetical protein
MIDVKKLRNTIDELENHSATLARVAGLYDKLEIFKAELDVLHNIISEDGGLLRETEVDMRASTENLRSQLAQMTVELEALRTEIDKDNTAMRQEIDNHLEAFAAALEALRTDIDKGSAEMRQEINNRFEAFAVDQKSALGTLLNDMQSLQNKHRSDIEVAIRNEGTQVQRGLENIVKEKHLALQTILEQRFADMSVKIDKQHMYSFIGFALMGMNAILILVALWFLRHQIF